MDKSSLEETLSRCLSGSSKHASDRNTHSHGSMSAQVGIILSDHGSRGNCDTEGRAG